MTFVEPSRRNDKSPAISSNDGAVDEPIKWGLMGRLFCRPFLLVFFLASALRMGAGYCFAYNNQVGLDGKPRGILNDGITTDDANSLCSLLNFSLIRLNEPSL